MKLNLNINLTSILLIIIGILFFVSSFNMCENRELKEKIDLENTLKDSLKIYKNKNEELVYTIEVLQSSKQKYFLNLKTKDSTIKILQKRVREYKNKLKKGGSVTHINTITKIDTVINTKIINDTIYNVNFKDKWVSVNINSDPKYSKLHLKFKNQYDVIIGEKRISLFKYKPFVDVINYNPYSEVRKLRTYRVKKYKSSKFNIGIYSGYGININKNPNFDFQIGIGINYTLIKL